MPERASVECCVEMNPIAHPDSIPPQNVLVVEDDLYLRRVLVRTLAQWGCTIWEVGDGGAAVDLITTFGEAPLLILLDIMLPVLNGIEVARQVLDSRPDLQIIACSAAMTPEIESELRTLGVSYFLPKPYTAESLLDTLRHVWDERQSEAG